eukprot:6192716-Pleurochrysis_carterae.AAC.2
MGRQCTRPSSSCASQHAAAVLEAESGETSMYHSRASQAGAKQKWDDRQRAKASNIDHETHSDAKSMHIKRII